MKSIEEIENQQMKKINHDRKKRLRKSHLNGQLRMSETLRHSQLSSTFHSGNQLVPNTAGTAETIEQAGMLTPHKILDSSCDSVY